MFHYYIIYNNITIDFERSSFEIYHYILNIAKIKKTYYSSLMSHKTLDILVLKEYRIYEISIYKGILEMSFIFHPYICAGNTCKNV